MELMNIDSNNYKINRKKNEIIHSTKAQQSGLASYETKYSNYFVTKSTTTSSFDLGSNI